MLQAKTTKSTSKGKEEALKEIRKEDEIKAFFAELPGSYYWKLKDHLHYERISMLDWLKSKIDDI